MLGVNFTKDRVAINEEKRYELTPLNVYYTKSSIGAIFYHDDLLEGVMIDWIPFEKNYNYTV
jgi:hypothetical protein